MSTFFRKRPPYTPRPEPERKHEAVHEDDFPVIGPASEPTVEDDYPVLEAEVEVEASETNSDDDFPVVGPAAEVEDVPVATPAVEPPYSNHLESALESILNEEMSLAEQRIRQRIAAELKKHLEN